MKKYYDIYKKKGLNSSNNISIEITKTLFILNNTIWW